MEKKILMGFIAGIAVFIALIVLAVIFFSYLTKIPALVWLIIVILCMALLNYMRNKYGKSRVVK